MKQQWTVKIRTRGWAACQSCQRNGRSNQKFYTYTASKHPCSTLHLATEVTENTSPTPLTPDESQNSWITPAIVPKHRIWTAANTHVFPPSSQLKPTTWIHMQVGNALDATNAAILHCGRKSENIPSKLTVYVRPFGKLSFAFTTACAGIHLPNFLMSQELQGKRPCTSRSLTVCGAV